MFQSPHFPPKASWVQITMEDEEAEFDVDDFEPVPVTECAEPETRSLEDQVKQHPHAKKRIRVVLSKNYRRCESCVGAAGSEVACRHLQDKTGFGLTITRDLGGGGVAERTIVSSSHPHVRPPPSVCADRSPTHACRTWELG